MAKVNGHGGDIALGTESTTIDAHVRAWTMEDTAQLHDVTFMSTTVAARTFFKGLETWTLTAEFYADSAMKLDLHSPGDSATTVTLDATGGTAAQQQYVFTGIVETMTFTRDVDGAARGTIRIKGNTAATMTRPDATA